MNFAWVIFSLDMRLILLYLILVSKMTSLLWVWCFLKDVKFRRNIVKVYGAVYQRKQDRRTKNDVSLPYCSIHLMKKKVKTAIATK